MNCKRQSTYCTVNNYLNVVLFSICEKTLCHSASPLHLLKHIVFGPATQSFVIPHSRAAVLNDNPPSRSLMKTKALFCERPPVLQELRPCVGDCVTEAWRWCRDDPGLKAEEKRVVVRRMNSDWRSAQWQLNDLRSVDSVSINQAALSRSLSHSSWL